MVVEAVVGPHVVVEVDSPVEVGVPVVGVLHEHGGGVGGDAVEGAAVDGGVVAGFDRGQRRVVRGVAAGGRAGQAVTVPRAAIAGGVDHRLDRGELRGAGVIDK